MCWRMPGNRQCTRIDQLLSCCAVFSPQRPRQAPGRQIVVISGSNTGQGERRAMALGANVYIAKPVDADSLVPQLKTLLARLSRTEKG